MVFDLVDNRKNALLLFQNYIASGDNIWNFKEYAYKASYCPKGSPGHRLV